MRTLACGSALLLLLLSRFARELSLLPGVMIIGFGHDLSIGADKRDAVYTPRTRGTHVRKILYSTIRCSARAIGAQRPSR